MNPRSPNPRAFTIADRANQHFSDLGLQLKLVPTAVLPEQRQAVNDAFAEVSLGSARKTYRLEYKRVSTAPQLAVLGDCLSDSQLPPLLLTEHVSRDMAKIARRLGIEFIDASGNAYLAIDGSLVWSVGNQRMDLHDAGGDDGNFPVSMGADHAQPYSRPSTNTGSVAATKILLVLLSNPQAFAYLTQRELAVRAKVGLGTVSSVLKAFEERGWIRSTERAGSMTGRMGGILEPELLLQEFAVNYGSRLRDRITMHRCVAQVPLDPDRRVSIPGTLWGGEVAADCLLGTFHPSTFVIYVDTSDPAAYRSVVTQFRLKPAKDGNFIIMERFWRPGTPQEEAGYVPSPLIYAELLASANPRALELANTVRKHWRDNECDPR